MQARYYDPVIGRFYSNDPVGFDNVHNFNRYAYVNNNPYKYVDPDGESPAAAASQYVMYTAIRENSAFESAKRNANNQFDSAVSALSKRVSVSTSGTAGLGLGGNAKLTVDKQTMKGEGIKLSGALTATAHGASVSATGNLTIIASDKDTKGPITKTTIMAGNGLGGGVTLQYTPSIALTIHAGTVAGFSVHTTVAGGSTRIGATEDIEKEQNNE